MSQRKRRLTSGNIIQSDDEDNLNPPTSPPPFQDEDSEEEIAEDVPAVVDEEEEEGEDLFDDGMMNDYKEIPKLDTYDPRLVDDSEYDELDPQKRGMVDQILNRRDRDAALREGRIPEAFLPEVDDRDFGESKHMRFGRFAFEDEEGEAEMQEMEDMAAEALSEADVAKYSLQEFVLMENYRRRIAYDYKTFLTTYLNEDGTAVYNAKIRKMCSENLESLEVSYNHLMEANAFLAKLITNVPFEVIKIFDEATMAVVLEQFEDYHRIQSEIHVRIVDFPTVDKLSDLRNSHLNCLVRVSGVVTRRTGVFPQLTMVKYDCGKCGFVLGPFSQDGQTEVKPSICARCQSKGPFSVNSSLTLYRNFQRITLQESPGTVPAGRLPRHKQVILLADLIDCARPGEELEVTGIYKNNMSHSLNNKHGFPVFETVIEANHVFKRQDEFSDTRLTEEDAREIRRLAQDERIGQRIIKSIAPSIYGHMDIKTAIALSMFGGCAKNIQGKHQVRGDINVLLLGDPGTAKSQFLKYVEKTSHRAVYTTGQGASAVGLTASVHKDPVTREWTLEGGALVLADKGVCLIDEFDKMNDADRTSIHEAMEQQSISISKAGIVTTLQARCAVIAAANPVRGRYNASLPFSQNVELTEPILSRFDVLCVVKDVVDADADLGLAQFVISSHVKSHPLYDSTVDGDWVLDLQGSRVQFDLNDILPQSILKKYIMYAKAKVQPQLSEVDVNKIARLYSELRRESLNNGGIPITVRHIESIVRMSEAHARMHLRDQVRADDIDVAIQVMLNSFIQAQKFSVMKNLNRAFAKYITYKKDHFELLLFLLNELMRETLRYYHYRFGEDKIPKIIELDMDDFESRAKELEIHDFTSFYSSRMFESHGYRLKPEKRIIERDS